MVRIASKKPLESWLAPYETPAKIPKTIAIVMAGNIPLVGFHDFIATLISGTHSGQTIFKRPPSLSYLATY